MELNFYKNKKLDITCHVDGYEYISEGSIWVGIKVENMAMDPIAKHIPIKWKYKRQGYFSYRPTWQPYDCPKCGWIMETQDEFDRKDTEGCQKCGNRSIGAIVIYSDFPEAEMMGAMSYLITFEKMELIEDGVLIYSYTGVQTRFEDNVRCTSCGYEARCFKMNDIYLCKSCWDKEKRLDYPELEEETVVKDRAGFKYNGSDKIFFNNVNRGRFI